MCMVGQFLCTYVRTSVRTHIPHMRLCSKYTHVTPYIMLACVFKFHVRIQGVAVTSASPTLVCMVGQFLCTYVRTSVRTHIPHMRLCSKYTHVTPYIMLACVFKFHVRIQGVAVTSMDNRQLHRNQAFEEEIKG